MPSQKPCSDPGYPLDFPVLQQFKAEGGTDYAALPMIRSDGETNAITFLTDRTGGFTDSEIAGLEYIAQAPVPMSCGLSCFRRVCRPMFLGVTSFASQPLEFSHGMRIGLAAHRAARNNIQIA